VEEGKVSRKGRDMEHGKCAAKCGAGFNIYVYILGRGDVRQTTHIDTKKMGI